MRRCTLLIPAVLAGALASGYGQEHPTLTSDQLPEFLARYQDGLRPLDKVFSELAEEPLPLRGETGQALTRREVENRRQFLGDLRSTVQQFSASPEDLVMAIRFFLESEALADDLFVLAQAAYDNNREELGKRLSDAQTVMEHHNTLIASYVLDIAEKHQRRLRDLENENAGLRKKVGELSDRVHPAESSPR